MLGYVLEPKYFSSLPARVIYEYATFEYPLYPEILITIQVTDAIFSFRCWLDAVRQNND